MKTIAEIKQTCRKVLEFYCPMSDSTPPYQISAIEGSEISYIYVIVTDIDKDTTDVRNARGVNMYNIDCTKFLIHSNSRVFVHFKDVPEQVERTVSLWVEEKQVKPTIEQILLELDGIKRSIEELRCRK